MVAEWTIASDVVQNVAFLATPPLLWLFLYLFAWESTALARASGFTRLTFWLLLPGSLLGTIANLPFVPIGGDVLAINIGGGLVPLVLTAYLLHRYFDESRSALARFAALFALESGAALALVLLMPSASVSLGGSGSGTVPWSTVGVAIVAAGVPVAARLTAGSEASLRRVAFVLALSSLCLFITFLTTSAVPGLGIESSFPGYLLAPMLVGGLAVGLARSAAGRAPASGLSSGYGAATLGVLVGADLLRQPPLYGGSGGAIYAIGGAGLLDLLYLSGLLAVAAGFLTYLGLRRFTSEPAPAPVPAVETLTPTGRLRFAFALLVEGGLVRATQQAARAAGEARATARSLAGLPAVSFTGRPWADLGAPPWVDGDHENLDALARQGDLGARDAWRAHLTARYLVRMGRDVSRRRFGTASRRGSAFLLDLLLLTLPAIPIWAYLSVAVPGTAQDVLASAAFNAAALGYAAYALVYFVVAERVWGTTLGKRAFRLKVRDRALRRAGTLPVVVRDLPKVIPLTLVGFTGAVITFVLLRGLPGAGAVATSTVFSLSVTLAEVAVLLAGVIVGLGLCAMVSMIAIAQSTENQRLGDYLAGTWVIQE